MRNKKETTNEQPQELSLEQLKAIAFDLLREQEGRANILRQVQAEINKREEAAKESTE